MIFNAVDTVSVRFYLERFLLRQVGVECPKQKFSVGSGGTNIRSECRNGLNFRMERDITKFDIWLEKSDLFCKVFGIAGIFGIPYPSFTGWPDSTIQLTTWWEFSLINAGGISIVRTVLLIVDVLRDFLVKELLNFDLIEWLLKCFLI